MNKPEIILKRLSTAELVSTFEQTDTMPNDDITPTIRGWIMDELEARDATAFEAWMSTTESSPRQFFTKPVVH